MHHLEGVEIPDYDVRLETHMSPLTGCNVLACLCDFNHRDVIVMTSEELLCS